MRNTFLKFRFALLLGLVLALAGNTSAQTPTPAAIGQPKSEQGFYPGWNLGTRFEGSTSSDGSVYDLGIAGGYNFSHHFGVGLGVPFYFVGTPSSVSTSNKQAVSGSG